MHARHARRREPSRAPKVFALLFAALGLLFATVAPAHAINADGARALAVVQPSPSTVGPAQLQPKAVTATKIAPGAVFGSHIQRNTIPWEAFGSQFRGEFRALQYPIIGNERIAEGTIFPAQLSSMARDQLTYLAALTEPKVIANIGGPINTQGTKLGLGLQLKRGTYLVTVSGQINRTTAAASPGKQTQPQLSLWLDRNRDGEFTWQTEGGISPNGIVPDLAGRSTTVSGQAVVKVEQSTPLDLDLVAHGYNNDQSGAGSGELTVGSAVISAIPLAAE